MEGRDSRRAVRVFGVGLVVVLAAGAVAAPGPGNPRGYGGGGGGGGGGYGGGSVTPTPTATVTATPTATTTPPDKTPPSVNSRVARGQTARSILKKGLLLKIRCNEACRHVTQVYVTKQQARKLLIKKKAKHRVRVGRKVALLQPNVARNIRVKLTKKARRGIKRMKRKHVRKLKLTIATAGTDAAKNTRRSSTTLSFKR
jgi:hypothetical protein